MPDTTDSALDIIKNTFSYYGLDDPALLAEITTLWGNKTIVAGMSVDDIGVQLKDSPAFAARFPANKALAAAGKPQYSVSQYLRLESDYKSRLQSAGMPPNFYDTPQDFQKLIANDVSPDELSARIQLGYQAVKNAPQQVIDQFKSLYGVSEGDLAAYFIDPEAARPTFDRYEAERQARSAAISAQAMTQANMQLDRQQAETLARAGITSDQAQQGFADIQNQQELFSATTAELAAGKQDISSEQQIAGTFSTNAEARKKIADRKRERQAAFQQGGNLMATTAGVAGLGTLGQ